MSEGELKEDGYVRLLREASSQPQNTSLRTGVFSCVSTTTFRVAHNIAWSARLTVMVSTAQSRSFTNVLLSSRPTQRGRNLAKKRPAEDQPGPQTKQQKRKSSCSCYIRYL